MGLPAGASLAFFMASSNFLARMSSLLDSWNQESRNLSSRWRFCSARMPAASVRSTLGPALGGASCESTTPRAASTVSLAWQQGHVTCSALGLFFAIGTFYAFSPKTARRRSPESLLHFGIFRASRSALVGLQRFLGQLDGFLKLRIVAAYDQVGPLGHDVIGIDAVIFDDPFAAIVSAPEAEAGRGDGAAIAQRLNVPDADQATPGARAHDRADFLATEEPREGVTAGAREFVDDHDFWAINRDRRPGNVLGVARCDERKKLAL